jgi:hypothetical protein
LIFSTNGIEGIDDSYFQMFNLENTNTVFMPYLFNDNHWVLIIVYFDAKSIKIIDPLCPNALFPNHEFVSD